MASSIGQVLPIFGASLFERVPSTFAPLDRIPVTADYVVGPGDQILLRVWGQVNLDLELTVDDDGVGARGAASAGLGLQNTRSRLEQLYGDPERLQIEERAQGGLIVRLRVPLRMAAGAQPAPLGHAGAAAGDA